MPDTFTAIYSPGTGYADLSTRALDAFFSLSDDASAAVAKLRAALEEETNAELRMDLLTALGAARAFVVRAAVLDEAA
jgi:hypothetical protein